MVGDDAFPQYVYGILGSKLVNNNLKLWKI